MAVANLVVQQFIGAGPTKTTVTVPRMSTSDVANPGTANPLPIPAAGLTYSYWMTLHLTITNIQSATLLNNHKFYCDEGTDAWTLGTSGNVFIGVRDAGDNGVPVASYDQATGTPGVTGDDMDDDTLGHAYYKAQTPESAVISDYTSAAKLTVDTGNHTIAEAFKGVVIQARVDTAANGAVRGAQAASTLSFVWDEV